MNKSFYFRKIQSRQDIEDICQFISNNIVIKGDIYNPFFRLTTLNSLKECREYVNNCLRSSFHDFYMIINKDDDRSIGFAFSYEFRMYDSNCKIFVWCQDEITDEQLLLIIDGFSKMLFTLYPIKKQYAEMLEECNTINLYKQSGFTIECVLKEYVYSNGGYHSLSILGKERE